jgi:polar amino acid transport system substrate-binding protein
MRALLLLLTLFSAFFPAAAADKLHVVTEVWEPYNYMEGDKPVGLSTDLVLAALKRANIEYELEVLPWKRAYAQALSEPNTAIFTVTRTPAREGTFKWVGPLYPQKEYFYKLKRRADLQVKTIEDLKAYQVGVLNGGSTQETLMAKGFENGVNLSPVTNASQNIIKLFLDRIDFTIGSDAKFVFQLRNTPQYKFAELEKSLLLSDAGGYYLALNKQTPDEVVKRLQKALDQLIAEGRRDKIWRAHLGSTPFEWTP